MSELITVKSVENHKANNGREYRRVQLAGGRWANVWDEKIALDPGHAYLAELESKPGKETGVVFWRINAATPSQAANGAAPAPTEGGRERRIQAECALKCAVETAHEYPLNDGVTPTALQQLILEWADKYLAWLLANDGTRAAEEPF